MFKPVLWIILVEETNRYTKTHNTSNWKDVTTAEMKGFLSVMFSMGLIKRNKLNDYWKTKYESPSTPRFRKMGAIALSYPPPLPPPSFFLFMILVQNFILIKNHIET